MAKRKSYTISSELDFGEVARDEHIAKDLWWLLTLRGVALLLLGFFALLWPGITLLVFGILLGVYFLVTGIVDIIVGVRSFGHHGLWFLRTLLGILELVVGVYILDQGVAIAVLTLILLIGVFFIFQGIVEIVSSFRTSKDVGMRLWLIFVGLIGVIAGMVVLRQPVASGVVFTWLIGFYGVFAGALSIAAGLGMRPKKSKA